MKHDDRIDVLASTVAYRTSYLMADTKIDLADWEKREAGKYEKLFWKGTVIGDAMEKAGRVIRRGQRRPVRQKLRTADMAKRRCVQRLVLSSSDIAA